LQSQSNPAARPAPEKRHDDLAQEFWCAPLASQFIRNTIAAPSDIRADASSLTIVRPERGKGVGVNGLEAIATDSEKKQGETQRLSLHLLCIS
jgi:hypothetical protein